MSDQVLVALITVGVGGAFAVVLRWVDQKTQRAQNAMGQNKLEVETATAALVGVKQLADELRIELDRKNAHIKMLDDEITELTKDLIEERAIVVAMSRERRPAWPPDGHGHD